MLRHQAHVDLKSGDILNVQISLDYEKIRHTNVFRVTAKVVDEWDN